MGSPDKYFLDDRILFSVEKKLSEFHMQNTLDAGYDEYTIAIVIGSKQPDPIENIWKQIERHAAS
jgi:hypothetical protein